jgi:hypothetical protein
MTSTSQSGRFDPSAPARLATESVSTADVVLAVLNGTDVGIPTVGLRTSEALQCESDVSESRKAIVHISSLTDPPLEEIPRRSPKRCDPNDRRTCHFRRVTSAVTAPLQNYRGSENIDFQSASEVLFRVP